MNNKLTQPIPIAVTANSRSRLKASANNVVPKAGGIAICNTSTSRGAPAIPKNVNPVPITKGTNSILIARLAKTGLRWCKEFNLLNCIPIVIKAKVMTIQAPVVNNSAICGDSGKLRETNPRPKAHSAGFRKIARTGPNKL